MGFRIFIHALKTKPALRLRLLTASQHEKRFEKSICKGRRVPDFRWGIIYESSKKVLTPVELSCNIVL